MEQSLVILQRVVRERETQRFGVTNSQTCGKVPLGPDTELDSPYWRCEATVPYEGGLRMCKTTNSHAIMMDVHLLCQWDPPIVLNGFEDAVSPFPSIVTPSTGRETPFARRCSGE